MTTCELIDYVSIRVLTTLEALLARELVAFECHGTPVGLLWSLTHTGHDKASWREAVNKVRHENG